MKKLALLVALCLSTTNLVATTINTTGYISQSTAKQIALTNAGVNAQDAIFIKTELDIENGKPEIEVEFYTKIIANGASIYKEYDYSLDALTGAIISSDLDIEEFHNGVSTANNNWGVPNQPPVAQYPGNNTMGMPTPPVANNPYYNWDWDDDWDDRYDDNWDDKYDDDWDDRYDDNWDDGYNDDWDDRYDDDWNNDDDDWDDRYDDDWNNDNDDWDDGYDDDWDDRYDDDWNNDDDDWDDRYDDDWDDRYDDDWNNDDDDWDNDWDD